jgi:hypothetical protein
MPRRDPKDERAREAKRRADQLAADRDETARRAREIGTTAARDVPDAQAAGGQIKHPPKRG